MRTTRARGLLAVAGVAAGVVLGAPAASADSGTVGSSTSNALADFWDLHDYVTVCDRYSGNPDGAIGILEVRQADGRFEKRFQVTDYVPGSQCVQKHYDVLREASDVRLTACDISRAGVIRTGTCRSIIIPG